MLNKKERYVIIIGIFILLIPLVCVYMLYINKIHYLYSNDYMELDSLVCVVYEAELEGTSFYIEGGIALPGIAENYTRENKYLYFKDNNTGEMYETRVGEIIIGDKLKEYISDENDYSIAGFAAKLDLSPLDIYNNSYSIYCCEQNIGINMIKDTCVDIDYGKLVFE